MIYIQMTSRHMKMVSIMKKEGNAKENHNEMLLPPMRMATIITKQRTSVGR